jgi:glycogen debranching enzyme
MLHFTPIQEVGQSGSAYSLYNQNMISNRIFSAHHVVDAAPSQASEAKVASTQLVDEEWEAQKRKRLKEVFDFGIAKGVLTLGDVVLNHTANNSNWLEFVCLYSF